MSAVSASARSVPFLVAFILIVGGVVLAVVPPTGLPPADARAIGLAVGTVGLWATGLIAESLTALLFFTLAMLAKVAPPEIVFAGFVSSAFWLILSGLIIGAAIRHSGLGDRIAGLLARPLGRTYRGALTGVTLFGLAMAFVMPSAMGRIALMLPILAALAERLGHPDGSRGHHGLVLGGIFGTYLPSSAILPANVPNNVMAGMVETLFGDPLAFGSYLLDHFPVLGLVKTAMLIAVLLALYGRETATTGKRQSPPIQPMSPVEKRLSVVLATALAFWSTDSLHHLSPAWVGMAAAVLCLFPPLALLPRKALQSINLEPVFYVGAIISLGALVAHVDPGHRLVASILDVLNLAPGRSIANFVQLCGLSTVVGLFVTLPGVPAVLTPFADLFAKAGDLSPAAVLVTQVVGFSTVILPYQAPPLVMAMQVADLPRRAMSRLCLMTAATTIVILWPLDVLWLSLLGVI
ncbi:SLC13 family permease [Telmatospirillum sp.]|uniref:SLC13 family permease n=1 Tax=Telmatospirillum sp. TaxID=2079197 RepID=UPI00283D8771|nr:SLC13 family permease [Telmatospirillum sp.]MDR3439531.1 anion permease [Telmatospirillum sp.]